MSLTNKIKMWFRPREFYSGLFYLKNNRFAQHIQLTPCWFFSFSYSWPSKSVSFFFTHFFICFNSIPVVFLSFLITSNSILVLYLFHTLLKSFLFESSSIFLVFAHLQFLLSYSFKLISFDLFLTNSHFQTFWYIQCIPCFK